MLKCEVSSASGIIEASCGGAILDNVTSSGNYNSLPSFSENEARWGKDKVVSLPSAYLI